MDFEGERFHIAVDESKVVVESCFASVLLEEEVTGSIEIMVVILCQQIFQSSKVVIDKVQKPQPSGTKQVPRGSIHTEQTRRFMGCEF